jgi:hypothetical protein
MKNNTLLLLMVLFFFQACKKDNQTNTFSFPKEIKLVVKKEIKFDKIGPLINPSDLYIKNDFLFISSSKTDSILYIYSLPELKYVNSYGRHGAGPNEFGECFSFCMSSDSLIYFKGYSNPMQISSHKVDKNGLPVIQQKYKIKNAVLTNFTSVLTDSIFMYFDIDQLTIKQLSIKNGKIIRELKMPKDDHKEPFFYSNQGVLASNGRSIVYTYSYKKQIDIYDVNLSLKKSVVWDHKQIKPTIGDFNNTVHEYLNIYAGQKYFYVLYSGMSDASNSKTPQKNYSLEVYDYNGNPVVKYALEKIPVSFTVDEKRGLLYGFDYRNEGIFYVYEMTGLKY